MARGSKSYYRCVECGYSSVKWMGRCPSCGAWESFKQDQAEKESTKSKRKASLSPISGDFSKKEPRIKTGTPEFDRILGGGLVEGSVVLLAGEPGIGKSTILLQLANQIAENKNVVYATGEESFKQVALRAKRLGVTQKELLLVSETDVLSILNAVRESKPSLLIADSVQAFSIEDIQSAPGSLVQVREVTSLLVDFAKKTGIPVIMIGHVTKQGNIAGPKVLEHMVDTVLYFEGDSSNIFRIIRTTKNRFGPTNEIGVFEMTDRGLIAVGNPSAAFLSGQISEGGIIFPALEGTRVILSEIQSLVSESAYLNPRRVAQGIDHSKLSLQIATLEARADVSFAGCDVYLSTSSGLYVKEPALDLPAAISLYLGLTNKSTETIGAFGELGLDGSVRPVFKPEPRIKELQRMGVKRVVLPAYDRINLNGDNNIELIKVKKLGEALEVVR